MNLAPAPAPAAVPSMPVAGKLKAVKAAQDFEAILLGSVLESLQKTFAGDSPDASPGSDTYARMGSQALASAIAEHGGIGLARIILRQWQQTKVPELVKPEGAPAT